VVTQIDAQPTPHLWRAPGHRTTPTRRLDRKLAAILGGTDVREDFILADAKDADMAFGVTSPGPLPGSEVGDARPRPGVFKTRAAYLDDMRALVAADLLDIVLTSAANGEILAGDGSLGDEVTLAVRANDTTDIWNARGGSYPQHPSRPFRTADLASVRHFCDLVLYSVTFNNELDHDVATLEAYRDFRAEASALGIRHFLEVFNPNAPVGLAPDQVGGFVNDSIIRCLAGVTSDQRPAFLKMAFNGPGAVAELVEHDPTLVVGILGGSAGTTRDTFELLARGQAAGARVALFGRKIQRAESQLGLVTLMRAVLAGDHTPESAVHAYHDQLAADGIAPHRDLESDLAITDPAVRG
jgi:hypothetical protein